VRYLKVPRRAGKFINEIYGTIRPNLRSGAGMDESDGDPPPDAHATLVVIGPGELEQQYAFDALIDDTDG
jgi:hypothetical protein